MTILVRNLKRPHPMRLNAANRQALANEVLLWLRELGLCPFCRAEFPHDEKEDMDAHGDDCPVPRILG